MLHNKRVLIIDDEIDLCLLLKSYLLRKNYEVYISYSLQDGLSRMEELRPAIVFLDNNLPDGIGWPHAPEMASKYPSTLVVLISAFHPTIPAMPPHAHYKYIEKPITIADLDEELAGIESLNLGS
jgi:DNA-binding NtrC family response regulator